MSISDFESRLQEQIKSLVAAHLSKFEHEVANLQQTVEQLVKSSFGRVMETANQGLQEMAIDSSLSTMAREVADELNAQTAAAAQSKASTNLAMLKVSINEIQANKTQADVLSALVSQASSFSPRVALFIVKSGNAVGWMARGFDGEIGNDSLKGFTLSLQSDTLLRTVLSKQITFNGEPHSQAENYLLFQRFGKGTPTRIAGIPLLVRGKAAAVLYADSGNLLGEAINIDALEILVNLSGTTIELISVRPRTPESTQTAPSAMTQSLAGHQVNPSSEPVVKPVAPAAPVVIPSVVTPSVVTPPVAPPPVAPGPVAEFSARIEPKLEPRVEPVPQPVVEPRVEPRFDVRTEAPPVVAPVPPRPVMPTPQAQPQIQPPAPAPLPSPSVEPKPAINTSFASLNTEPPMARSSVPSFDIVPEPPAKEPAYNPFAAPAPQQSFGEINVEPSPWHTEPPAPSPVPKPATHNQSLPVPANEEEQKLHNDARRFARLLVSEIKLYNEQKVLDGRKNHDLYDRLKEDIDRSRQMYDKRVSALVASKFDYFYDELVNTLAEGDAIKLGRDCPGPSVHVS